MRSRSHFIIVGLFLMAAFLISVVGCSDDKAPTKTITGNTDTIADPSFSPVQTELDIFVGETFALINDGLGMGTASTTQLDSIVFGPFVPADSSTVEWKIYYLLQAGLQISGLDSIQFSKNGNPLPSGAGADKVHFIHYYKYDNNDTTVTNRNMDIHSDLVMAGVDGIIGTINGTHDLIIVDRNITVDSNVVWTYDIQATYTNLVVNKSGGFWNQGCPASGSATATVVVTYQKDAATPIVNTYQITITFTNGNAQISATLGSTTTDYNSQICTVN